MCLIADANKLGDFLREPPTEDTEPIHNWLHPGRRRRARRGHAAESSRRPGGVIVYSTAGKFRAEISRAARVRLDELRRSGHARFFNESELNAGRGLVAEERMASNDWHVLALAAVSRAEVLYTADRDLMNDFRDKRVMGNLRGKIYSGAKSRGILHPDMCGRRCE